MLGILVLIGGCDRESGDAAQPAAGAGTQAASSAPAAGEGMIDRSHKGEPLPALTLSDPAGKTLKLAEATGKPLLINLWATWCAPCVKEMPQLDAIAAKGDMRVLTISQDTGGADKVAAFFAERKLANLEPWLDPKNDVMFHYDASNLPTSVLYDAQGREVWRYVGGNDWTSAEAVKLLAEG
jgi:thiol-disulfide isomerase/thioredoxin